MSSKPSPTILVCDSNVIISAFLFPGGYPDKILRAILAGRFRHATSPDILTELRQVFGVKFKLDRVRIEELIQLLVGCSELAYPDERLEVIKKDKTDNRILECAMTCNASHIITGDKKHLLPLKAYNSIQIVAARTFALQHGIL